MLGVPIFLRRNLDSWLSCFLWILTPFKSVNFPILRHGARAWTEKYPRYTVFMRYIYANQFHSNESDRWPPYEKYRKNISDELYELESRDHGQRKILYKYLEKNGVAPKGSN